MNTGVDLFLPYVTCYVGSEGHLFLCAYKVVFFLFLKNFKLDLYTTHSHIQFETIHLFL